MQKEWANGVSGNPNNFGVKIKAHENTQSHLDASIAFGRWKAGQRIDRVHEQSISTEATFWRKCLLRIINIIMTLALMSLALRGHREYVGDGDCHGGNFLAPVAMQVSIIVRWVSIEGEAAQIRETFLTFIHTTDATAKGLADLVAAWRIDHGFDLAKIRGQGYDGASVMSGKVGGVQKLFRDIVNRHSGGVEVIVPFVHCAAHNLNLVNDAAEATGEGINFFGAINEIFNFFGRSLNRWAELALTEDGMHKLKLKKLCATRWASRIDAVRALKNRYADILKVLARISLTTKDAKERADATGLRKNMDNYDFVVCIVVWERILTSLYRASQKLQASNTDLSVSVRLLSAAHGDLKHLRESWDDVLLTANALSSAWGIQSEFKKKRQRCAKRFHDELSMDCRLADATQAFKVNVFYKILDVAIGQLEWRFEGQQLVAGLFSFIFPKTMLKLTDAELESNAESLRKAFPPDIGDDLISEVRSFRRGSFRREFRDELTSCESVKDVLTLLLSSSMLSSLPELGAACVLFCTLPVTVAEAERSFSKLKLIKTYLRSTIAQERLDSLAIISIENEAARALDLAELVDQFAAAKARKRKF